MGFGEAIATAFRKYVDFRGYATRPEYWWFALFNFLVSIATSIADAAVGSAIDSSGFSLLSSLWGLAVLLPGLALSVRRLRDAGYAWPWLFIVLVPIAGFIVLIVLMCQPSKQRVSVPTYSLPY